MKKLLVVLFAAAMSAVGYGQNYAGSSSKVNTYLRNIKRKSAILLSDSMLIRDSSLRLWVVPLTSAGGTIDTTSLQNVILNTSNVLYATGNNFTVSNRTATGTLTLQSQGAGQVFRTTTVGTPTFGTLDSTHIPMVHGSNWYAAINDAKYGSLSQQNTNTTNIALKINATDISQAYDYVISKSGSIISAVPKLGSGFTAYSGTDAYTVIQSAINQLTPSGIQGSGGGKIFIRSAIYDLSDELTIVGWEASGADPFSQLIIEGEGIGTLLRQITAGKNGLVVKNNASFALRDIRISAGNTSKSALLLDTSGVNNQQSAAKVQFDNLYLMSSNASYPGAYLKNFFQIKATQWKVENPAGDAVILENNSTTTNYGNSSFGLLSVICNTTTGTGLKIVSKTGNHFLNLIDFDVYQVVGANYGIATDLVRYCTFNHIDIEAVTVGIGLGVLGTGNANLTSGLTFNGGYILTKNGGTGLSIPKYAGGNKFSNITISGDITSIPITEQGNWYAPNSYDIVLDGAIPSTNSTVSSTAYLSYRVTGTSLSSIILPSGTIATTQTAGNNTTAVATTAYADAIAALKANIATPTFTTNITSPILYGGSGSGGNLTLGSTSNATKGKILLGSSSAFNESTNRLGIGTTSPGGPLHAVLNSTYDLFYGIGADPGFRVGGTFVRKAASIASGDMLGSFQFNGTMDSYATGPFSGAEIQGVADSVWTNGTQTGGRLDFYTTPGTSKTPLLALRIDRNQQSTFNGGIILDSALNAFSSTAGYWTAMTVRDSTGILFSSPNTTGNAYNNYWMGNRGGNLSIVTGPAANNGNSASYNINIGPGATITQNSTTLPMNTIRKTGVVAWNYGGDINNVNNTNFSFVSGNTKAFEIGTAVTTFSSKALLDSAKDAWTTTAGNYSAMEVPDSNYIVFKSSSLVAQQNIGIGNSNSTLLFTASSKADGTGSYSNFAAMSSSIGLRVYTSGSYFTNLTVGNSISGIPSSSYFWVNGTSKGSMPMPVMQNSSRLAIASPAQGLMAYSNDPVSEAAYIYKANILGWSPLIDSAKMASGLTGYVKLDSNDATHAFTTTPGINTGMFVPDSTAILFGSSSFTNPNYYGMYNSNGIFYLTNSIKGDNTATRSIMMQIPNSTTLQLAPSGSGVYVTVGPNAPIIAKLNVIAGNTSTVDQVIKQYTGQTADLLDFQNSSGVVTASVGPTGLIKLDSAQDVWTNAGGLYKAMEVPDSNAILFTNGNTGQANHFGMYNKGGVFYLSTSLGKDGTYAPTLLMQVTNTGMNLMTASGSVAAGGGASGSGRLNVGTTLASSIGLTVQGVTSQTGDLFQARGVGGSYLMGIGANGLINLDSARDAFSNTANNYRSIRVPENNYIQFATGQVGATTGVQQGIGSVASTLYFNRTTGESNNSILTSGLITSNGGLQWYPASFFGFSLNVGSTGYTPASAAFSVTGTTLGSIPFPVQTDAQFAAISSKADGLGYYSTIQHALYLNENGTTTRVMDSASTALTYTAVDLSQSYTSGTTVTVNNGTNILIVNPATTGASLTITLPATPHNSNEVQIYFGGTMTSGTVISSLTVSPNSGQTLLQATAPSSVAAGEAIIYKYNVATSKWYRKL